uniref:Uncharacterized protein n=1 Tax=Aegilops tauschii subsp. strangulata TaxID=200361 RepID=A0A453KCK1_AEGTS
MNAVEMWHLDTCEFDNQILALLGDLNSTCLAKFPDGNGPTWPLWPQGQFKRPRVDPYKEYLVTLLAEYFGLIQILALHCL